MWLHVSFVVEKLEWRTELSLVEASLLIPFNTRCDLFILVLTNYGLFQHRSHTILMPYEYIQDFAKTIESLLVTPTKHSCTLTSLTTVQMTCEFSVPRWRALRFPTWVLQTFVSQTYGSFPQFSESFGSGQFWTILQKKSWNNKWQVKKIISPPRKILKKLFIDFFISGYICPGTPSFDLPTPNFAGSSNLKSVPGPERRVKRFRCFRIGRR